MLVTCTDSMGLQEICLIEAPGKESLMKFFLASLCQLAQINLIHPYFGQ